jgi:hypothetical protein
MQKAVKIAAILLLSLMTVSLTAYAAIRFTLPISNTANIMGYEIQLWDTQNSTAITSFNWGDLSVGSTVDTDQLLGGYTRPLVIRNLDAYYIFVGWNCTNTLPSGVTLTAQYYNSGYGEYQSWPQNTYNLIPQLNPTSNSVPIKFILTVSASATNGPFSFTINVLAAETNVG